MLLVLGAGGLLGSHLSYLFSDDIIGLTHEDVDVTDSRKVEDFIDDINPDAVINCVGITPKHPLRYDDYTIFRINGEFPHWLGTICAEKHIKLIQISTDCVFGDQKGPHTEEDKPTPSDRYEQTKWLGEIGSPHLTIRTSFVGYPDPTGRGLLHWAAKHRYEKLEGYTNHIWNGLTTLALSKYIYHYAYSKDTGIRHVYGQAISKFQVLRIANKIYKWDKIISPASPEEDKNRLLSTLYPRNYIPGTGNYEEMITEMYKHRKGLTSWLSQSI